MMTAEDMKRFKKMQDLARTAPLSEMERWLLARLEAEAQENERLKARPRPYTVADQLQEDNEIMRDVLKAAEAERDAIREEWTRVFATLRRERDEAEATCQSLLDQSSRWEAQALEAAVENERLRDEVTRTKDNALDMQRFQQGKVDAAEQENERLRKDTEDMAYATGAMAQKLVAAEARCAELEALFALQRTRMTEATRAWQEATGKRDVLPDLGDLLKWLMARPAALGAEKEIEKLKAELRESEATTQSFLEESNRRGKQVRELRDALAAAMRAMAHSPWATMEWEEELRYLDISDDILARADKTLAGAEPQEEDTSLPSDEEMEAVRKTQAESEPSNEPQEAKRG